MLSDSSEAKVGSRYIHFKTFAQGQKTLTDLYADLTSAHPTTSARSTLDLMRQAGLVNLWFFLKVIAGFGLAPRKTAAIRRASHKRRKRNP